jgi:hypothetical protein
MYGSPDDRIVLTGRLHPFCYAQGMTHYVYEHQIRIFDFAQFAQPLSEQIRENTERLAQAHGLEIEYIRKKNFRDGSLVCDQGERYLWSG